EVSPDGSVDENVFDIKQGVSINFLIKTNKKKANQLAQVFSYDLFGKREIKYDFLLSKSLSTIPFKEINLIGPNYFFSERNFEEQKDYDKGFSLTSLFSINSMGIATARDHFSIQFSPQVVQNTIKVFMGLENEEARTQF